MWTLGLPGFLDDLYDDVDEDNVYIPTGLSTDQISRIQKGAELIRNDTPIYINQEMQRVEIGPIWVTFEQCLDILETNSKD